MLLNGQVFGKRAGQRAAEVGRQRQEHACKHSSTPALSIPDSSGATPVRDATRRIKQIMTEGALVVRNERGIEHAAQQLVALRE